MLQKKKNAESIGVSVASKLNLTWLKVLMAVPGGGVAVFLCFSFLHRHPL